MNLLKRFQNDSFATYAQRCNPFHISQLAVDSTSVSRAFCTGLEIIHMKVVHTVVPMEKSFSML